MGLFSHCRGLRPNAATAGRSWHDFCDISRAPVVASDQGRRLVIGTGASHVHCGGAPGPVVGGLPAPFYLRRAALQRKKPGIAGLFY